MKRISINQFVAFAICFLFILIFAGAKSAPSVVISFLSLLLLGHWLFRNHEETQRLFFYAFLLNSFFAIVLTTSFVFHHGKPFIGGGDDEMFYNIARDFKDGLRVFDYGRLPWDAINYKSYIVVLAGWLKALNVIGLSDDSFLNLNLVNSFFGAFSVVLIYRIFRMLTDETL